jgi:hypothetical protein
MGDESSRPEAAFVLLLMQATFWAMAGLSAFPFVLGGEYMMAALGLASLLLAALTVVLSVGVERRRRWARRWALGLETVCLAGSLLLVALPIGANRGPVSLMVNVCLPLALVLLLRGRRMRAAFAAAARPSR